MQLSKRDLVLCMLALSFTRSNCDALVEALDVDDARNTLADARGRELAALPTAEEFQELGERICLQAAAGVPTSVSIEDLTPSERATVLAALRFWQDEMGPHPHADGCYPDHFVDVKPLSSEAIDSLCERLSSEGQVEDGGSFYCSACDYCGDEEDFVPSDGNPAPLVCPSCGRTDCFPLD